MKTTIAVVGAAFVKEGKLFAARRSYGSRYVIHKYEFVGGKIEEGESGEQAIVRECREELDADVTVCRKVGFSSYEYPDKIVDITVYLCEMPGGYTVKEHEDCRWIPFSELNADEWAPADRGILEELREQFGANYALVTGATGHIGSAFCKELASRGENLFITGRSAEKLAALACGIMEKYPAVTVRYCPCDLADEKSRTAFFSAAAGYTFLRLINVAGADIQKAFGRYDEQKLVFQTRVLFEGAVSLTRFCLKYRAERLSVINISSMSGLYPMPYFAVYSALKGALTNFSLALGEELKGSGVTVTAVLPGAVRTRPDVIEYIKKQGLWGRIAAKSPEFVAKRSLKAASRGRAVYIPGVANRLLRAFTAPIPLKLKLKFIAKRWSRTEKDAF